jgi:hypothetical protein
VADIKNFIIEFIKNGSKEKEGASIKNPIFLQHLFIISRHRKKKIFLFLFCSSFFVVQIRILFRRQCQYSNSNLLKHKFLSSFIFYFLPSSNFETATVFF